MSKLTNTRHAFEAIEEMLNQQIRKGGSKAKELERFREQL
jgi:hypothetical protein